MYIQFSDAAKFADIARNIAEGKGWGSGFNFFDPNLISIEGMFPSGFTPPAMPYFISVLFKLFGVSDTSVIATSLLFFILTGIFTFILGNKLFGKTAGLLASSVVLINQNFWEYAKTGASESLFMFEIVMIPCLLLLKKTWATISASAILILMYFTRPQAFIFIAVYVLFYLLLKYKVKKAFVIFGIIVILGLIADRYILLPLNGKYFLYSITGRGTQAVVQHSQYIAVSDVVRGAGEQPASWVLTLKKTGTHLFNFYRSLPNIANPYLFAFFILSPLVLFRKKEEKVFTAIVFFAAILSFLLPALTIPFYRYIHPVLPLVYITGTASLTAIMRLIYTGFAKNLKSGPIKKYIPALLATSAVLIFVLIRELGIFIHDAKYYEVRTNKDKPPVYANFSRVLKENTQNDDFVITNLDTWGSWYGERKTMWFPLEPGQLIDRQTDTVFGNIDAIYLTSYLINDENYYMGEAWRRIYLNPEESDKWTCDGCGKIRDEFYLKGIYEIPASDSFEKYDARAVLLIRKSLR